MGIWHTSVTWLRYNKIKNSVQHHTHFGNFAANPFCFIMTSSLQDHFQLSNCMYIVTVPFVLIFWPMMIYWYFMQTLLTLWLEFLLFICHKCQSYKLHYINDIIILCSDKRHCVCLPLQSEKSWSCFVILPHSWYNILQMVVATKFLEWIQTV